MKGGQEECTVKGRVRRDKEKGVERKGGDDEEGEKNNHEEE